MAVDILNLGFKVDTSQVKTASKDLDKLSASVKKTDESLAGMTASSKTANTNTENLIGTFGRLGKGLAYIQVAKEFVGIMDEHTKYIAQLKIATNSTAEFNQALSKSQEIAAIAQTSVASIATVYARFANALKETNVSQEKVGLIAENVALGLKVSGANAGETATAMLQLSQAFGSGVLAGDEFKAMSENAPPLMRALAESMGVPVGQLKALAAEGKITAQVLTKAFSDTTLNEKLKKQAEQVKTVGGSFTNLIEQIKLSITSFDGAGATVNLFTSAVDGLTSALAILSGTKDIDIKVNVQFPNYEAYRKRMDEINRDLGNTGSKSSNILPQGSSMNDPLPRINIGKIGDVNEAFNKLKADFVAWQKVEPFKDATQKSLEYAKNLKMVSEAERMGILSTQEATRYRAQFKKEMDDAGKAGRESNESIQKTNRELLTSIEELVSGQRTEIQVLQDKLDHNKKITKSNRELAQSNLDLAKSLDFEAADRAAFDQGLQNESEIFDENFKQNQDYAEKMSANYTSMSEMLQKENEDLNASLIVNDRERAAEQLRIEHDRKVQMIQSMTDQSDEQDDLLAREMENYRLRNQELQSSQSIVKDLGLTFTSAFEDAVVAGNKLSDVLQSLLQDILKLVTRQLITNPLMGAIGGALQNILPASMGGYSPLPDFVPAYAGATASANGNVMTPNGAMKLNNYAKGGIATSPQVSIFGEGRMNEAYVPLPDGRSIPVSMKGGGSNVQVVVNNNTPAQATTNETVDSRGNRRIEVTISELVAGEIKRNGSSANTAIKNTFNTTPTLIGR
jgi:tape measure domain-containing protein